MNDYVKCYKLDVKRYTLKVRRYRLDVRRFKFHGSWSASHIYRLTFNFLLILSLPFLMLNCRKQLVATEVEMTEYGWELYFAKKNEEANDWFNEAVFEDSTYKDGYNGLGWTYGKLDLIGKSLEKFNKALPLDNDVNLLVKGHNTTVQIIAGLSLMQHSNGQYDQAIIWGDSILAMTGDDNYQISQGDPNWTFSRDKSVDSKDIIWVLSASHFALGNFEESLNRIYQLEPTPLENDISTINGRNELAERIETVGKNIKNT